MTIKVLIADDHVLVRQGLREYLDTSADIDVIAEASNGQEVLAIMETAQPRPDVALIDVRMPEVDGIEVARSMRKHYPDTQVIMLSAYDEDQYVAEAARAGARGYVLKTRDAEHLIQAVRLVAGGSMVIDPDIMVSLLGESGDRGPSQAQVPSATELEVLQLLAFGHTNTEIAEQLSMSREAVRSHLDDIYRKLRASDRTTAVAEALRRRLID
jgi:DNA-binding NarL/FixJ family response regulator